MLVQDQNFGPNQICEKLVKNRGRSGSILIEIEIYLNRNFGKKVIILVKVEIFVKNRNLCQKSKIEIVITKFWT